MKKYYYKDHHLYQAYGMLDNIVFNTREDYLTYCEQQSLKLKDMEIAIKNRYALEYEEMPPTTKVKVKLVPGTEIFDERDLSNFYFKDEADAEAYLAEYKKGSPAFMAEALFTGVAGEPDYSAEAIVENLLKNIVTESFDTEKEYKNVAHYIISYLPTDPIEKELRKKAHLNQLKSIKAISPNVKIFIIAQNYKDSDYIDDPQIEYYKYEPLGPMKACNTALKHFYESDYEFCILNDDDTVVAPTQSAINFINELESNSAKFRGADVIWSRDMLVEPYQFWELLQHNTYNSKWLFDFKLCSAWHYAVVRNFKKYYNKEEYQIETIDPSAGEGADDLDFCYYLHTQGYKLYRCLNALQVYVQNFENLKGSLVYTNLQNPWIRLNNRKKTEAKYLLNSENEVDAGAFIQKYGLGPRNFELHRDLIVDVLSEYTQRNVPELLSTFLNGLYNFTNKKYYYKDHHLYQVYCKFDNKLFNSREDYLDYCELYDIPLAEKTIKRKSKYALEWEVFPPVGSVKTTIAKGTIVFDERDLSNYYFNDVADAANFLNVYGEGNGGWAVSNLFSGYEGEPDYSPDGIVANYLKDIKTQEFNPTKEWKNIAHFIISYLPDDEDIRNKRKQAHLNQLQAIKAITPNAKVHIVAQNYKEEDYVDDPQIVYHKFDKLGAMRARNTALNLLYESDYDFGILSDDDTFVAPNKSAINFFEEIETEPLKFYDFDVIFSRDMYHIPFRTEELPLWEHYSSNWCFEFAFCGLWHWAVVKNFKKFYNKEEYQDESVDPTTGEGYDDVDFGYYLQTQGYSIWRNLNALHCYAQSWGGNDSVVYNSCETNPWIRINNNHNNTMKWLDIYGTGTPDPEGFRDRYHLHHTEKCLTRNEFVDVFTEFNQRNAPNYIRLYKRPNRTNDN